MENINQGDTLQTTESIGVTEMQNNVEDFFGEMKKTFGERPEEEVLFEENQPSFYDLAEQDGTLIYYQCDSNGNDLTGEDY